MVKRMSKNRLYIDETKCRKCGICVTACPVKVFEKRKETINICYDKLDFCINCKDCISVCPSGAITNQDFDLEKLPVNDIPYDIEKLLCNLKNRRTIRKYKNRSLTEEEMKYIGEVASLAPRGGHTEGVRNTGIIIVKDINVIKKIRNYSYDYICVLRKKLTSPILKISTIFNKSLNKSINSTVERIDLVLKLKQHDIDMITYDAPNLIILHCEKGSPISRENASIMEYQIMLGAEALGLGTCFLGWAGFALQSFQVRKAKELKIINNILEVPVNREIVAAFSIGQKQFKYYKIKNREKYMITVK